MSKKGGRVIPTFKDYLRNGEIFDNLTNGTEKLAESKDNGLIEPSVLCSESEDSDFEGN